MLNKQDITVNKVFLLRGLPIAVRLRAESPVINSTGQRPVGEMPSIKRSPERAESCKTNRISPFQGYGRRSSLSTGRCPVLLTTGLSALNLTAMGACMSRRDKICITVCKRSAAYGEDSGKKKKI
jgi:hypothetical protein